MPPIELEDWRSGKYTAKPNLAIMAATNDRLNRNKALWGKIAELEEENAKLRAVVEELTNG